jgi:hypothetical protein
MAERYHCQNRQRRSDVRNILPPRLNGIDYLEVLNPDQTELGLTFIHDVPRLPSDRLLQPENFSISGGVRIQNIRVIEVHEDPTDSRTLRLSVNQAGDFSVYTLRLVTSSVNDHLPHVNEPPLDSQLATISFSFKVNCPSEFDCPQPVLCVPGLPPSPPIDYLAKDYASFRQLMLDRLAITLPDWQERNPADIGIALVEVLAYAADHISYYQDAVATEAYLGTARQRASVRRHTRLLGYALHEGCNARTWVQVQVRPAVVNAMVAAKTPFLTQAVGQPTVIDPTTRQFQAALEQGALVFEALHPQRLFASHNKIYFYTWSDDNCCLPIGATRATLRHEATDRLHLVPGDVLIFEEVVSPQTGQPEDAALGRRHAVRLRQVEMQVRLSDSAIAGLETSSAIQTALAEIADECFAHDGELLAKVQTLVGEGYSEFLETQILTVSQAWLMDPLTDERVVDIEWYGEDALPFSLCISKTLGGDLVIDLTIVRGNLVLADHGQTLIDRPPVSSLVPAEVDDPDRYRPRLPVANLTHAIPYSHSTALAAGAAAALEQTPRAAQPAIVLSSGDGTIWESRHDLLNSDRFDRGFVVEMADNRTTHLRFGDGYFGQRPALGTDFSATYRLGSGRSGNVGAEAIAHLVLATEDALGDLVLRLGNPLPATGGIDPETLLQARLDAPQAFRVQQRAVTAEDYAAIAARHPQVQQAQATRRWTGSWYTWFLTVDRKGGLPIDVEFEQDLRQFLNQFRLAGYDLEIDAPRFVPLEIVFSVRTQPGYYPANVRASLLKVFSNQDYAPGQQGFFHPDQFTFGQPVYLSQVVATAMAVPGVQWVNFGTTDPRHRFQRWGQVTNQELDQGEISLKRLEIARLDNDPNAPENGRLNFLMEGGR